MNEIDATCNVLIQRALKPYLDTTNWIFIFTSNFESVEKMKFEKKFIDRICRHWKFESFTAKLEELLEKELEKVKEDSALQCSVQVKAHLRQVAINQGLRQMQYQLDYNIERSLIEKLDTLHIF